MRHNPFIFPCPGMSGSETALKSLTKLDSQQVFTNHILSPGVICSVSLHLRSCTWFFLSEPLGKSVSVSVFWFRWYNIFRGREIPDRGTSSSDARTQSFPKGEFTICSFVTYEVSSAFSSLRNLFPVNSDSVRMTDFTGIHLSMDNRMDYVGRERNE